MEECRVSLFTCRNNYFKDKNMVSVHGPLEGVGIELLRPKYHLKTALNFSQSHRKVAKLDANTAYIDRAKIDQAQSVDQWKSVMYPFLLAGTALN